MSSSKLSLLLSVDDRRPEEGGNVNFSLTARNDNASAIGRLHRINRRCEGEGGVVRRAEIQGGVGTAHYVSRKRAASTSRQPGRRRTPTH